MSFKPHHLLLLAGLLAFSTVARSQDFNSIISATADTLAKKINISAKKKVAITDFSNLDGSITQLGLFLSNEIGAELSNHTENQTRFRVLERANLDQIFKEKKLIDFADATGLAKELGKLDAADALIFATITDFDGHYRIVIKMLDTRNGDALASYKVNFVKSPSLENLSKIMIKSARILQVVSNVTTQPEATPANDNTGKNTGDYCFKHNSRKTSLSKESALVQIKKALEGYAFKTITVNIGESGCFYDIEPGVYYITITWSDGSWSSGTEYKEIRVVAGKSQSMEISQR